jgi:hypothetical protein
MILFIIKLCILIYLFYMIKYVYNMLQYNEKASLLSIQSVNKDKVELELTQKSPLVLSYPSSATLTFETMNIIIPGYIIQDNGKLISLEELSKSDSFTIYKNTHIIDDYQLEPHYSNIFTLFSHPLSCGQTNYISLYRGEQTTPLIKNYRETLIIQPILGHIIIYIFNPKHEKDIKGLDIKTIKKWAIKIDLNKDTMLYIPPEWMYFYESVNDVIVSQIECDSYPSFLFNYIRKK